MYKEFLANGGIRYGANGGFKSPNHCQRCHWRDYWTPLLEGGRETADNVNTYTFVIMIILFFFATSLLSSEKSSKSQGKSFSRRESLKLLLLATLLVEFASVSTLALGEWLVHVIEFEPEDCCLRAERNEAAPLVSDRLQITQWRSVPLHDVLYSLSWTIPSCFCECIAISSNRHLRYDNC